MHRRLAIALSLALAALGCTTTARDPAALAVPAPAPPEAQTPELDFLLGQELEMDGKLAEAYAAYQRALERDPEAGYLLKRLAQLAITLERPDEARGYAERALVLEPNDATLRLFLGQLYALQGERARLREVLADAQGNPISSDAAALLYRAAFDAGELEQARSVARWQIDHERDLPQGWLNLAEVTERQGDPAGAEKILREGDAANPGAVDYLAALAYSRRARGDRLGELGIYAEILKRAPNDASTWLAKAEAEFDLGRETDGRHSLERAGDLQPDDLRTAMRIALLDLQRGAPADAERRLARISDTFPEQYEVAYFLGVARRRMNDMEGAMQAFDRIPEKHARFADGRVQVASILEAQGDFAAARVEVERAQAVADDRELQFYHASLVAKAGDLAAGVGALEAMLDGTPADAEVLYNVGILQGEAKDVDAALASMHRAIALQPDHTGALNFIAYTWAERGERLDEAEAMLERALAQKPGDGFITDSLGWVYFMRARPLLAGGKKAEARSWLLRAREKLLEADRLSGGDPVISEHLGDVHAALSDKRAALASYERAVSQGPRTGEQPELTRKLERLRGELGRP